MGLCGLGEGGFQISEVDYEGLGVALQRVIARGWGWCFRG